jgi:hypothetical protein
MSPIWVSYEVADAFGFDQLHRIPLHSTIFRIMTSDTTDA